MGQQIYYEFFNDIRKLSFREKKTFQDPNGLDVLCKNVNSLRKRMSFFNSSMPSCYSTFTERRQLDQDLQYVLVAFYTTIMVCIWITNSAVIFAITSLKLVKKNGSIELILYLCVSDLALGSTGH